MALAFHLTFAFASVAHATYIFFRPSKTGLRATYALIALTFVSGFSLVFLKPAHMAEVCVAGLAYVGFVSYAIVSARNKLARALSSV